jgi:hypothetical protein
MSLHQQALHLVSYLGLINRCLLACRPQLSLHQQALHLVSYLGLIKRCLLAYRSADEPAPTSFALSFLFRLLIKRCLLAYRSIRR